MINRNLVEVFMNMPLQELKEYIDASEQESFANDSNVRILLKKYTRFGDNAMEYPIPYALTEMYIAMTHALYKRLNKIENNI